MESGFLSVEQDGLNNMHVCHDLSLILGNICSVLGVVTVKHKVLYIE